MQMSFSVAEIGGTKRKILIFYAIFLNTDISITTQDIAMIFLWQFFISIAREACLRFLI